jgi:hypothetical protein
MTTRQQSATIQLEIATSVMIHQALVVNQFLNVKLLVKDTQNVVMIQHVFHVIHGEILIAVKQRVSAMMKTALKKNSDVTKQQALAANAQVALHIVYQRNNAWQIVKEAHNINVTKIHKHAKSVKMESQGVNLGNYVTTVVAKAL